MNSYGTAYWKIQKKNEKWYVELRKTLNNFFHPFTIGGTIEKSKDFVNFVISQQTSLFVLLYFIVHLDVKVLHSIGGKWPEKAALKMKVFKCQQMFHKVLHH